MLLTVCNSNLINTIHSLLLSSSFFLFFIKRRKEYKYKDKKWQEEAIKKRCIWQIKQNKISLHCK